MPHAFDSKQSYMRLALCVLYATVGGVGQWSPVVLMPNFETTLGLDRAAASSLYAFTLCGFAIGSLIYGKLADITGPGRLMILSAVSMAVGYSIIAFSTSYATLAFTHFFFVGMLGSSTSFALVMSEISLWFNRRRGLAVAIGASGLYLAGVIWAPLLQRSIGPLGWQATHLSIAGICLVVMLVLGWIMGQSTPPAETETAETGKPVLDTAGLTPRCLQIMLCVAGTCCCVAMAMPQIHIVSYCITLGFGPAVGAQMLAMMLSAGVISRIGFGFIADWLGGARTLLTGSVLQMFAIASFLFFDGIVSLYAISIIFGLSQGGIVPSYALIVRQYFPASDAHWRVSLVATATVTGMAIGGWLPGILFDWTGGYRFALMNGVFWNLINISIISWLILRTNAARRVSDFVRNKRLPKKERPSC